MNFCFERKWRFGSGSTLSDAYISFYGECLAAWMGKAQLGFNGTLNEGVTEKEEIESECRIKQTIKTDYFQAK